MSVKQILRAKEIVAVVPTSLAPVWAVPPLELARRMVGFE